MAAEDAIQHRGQRHHKAADKAAFDSGRNWADFHWQPQAIAGHAGAQTLDFAGSGNHWLRALGGLDARLVPVTAAGQELRDPHGEADDK